MSGKSTLAGRVNFPLARRFARTIVGYGVIGSPADSGSVSLGSSPGTPAQYALQLNMDRADIYIGLSRGPVV